MPVIPTFETEGSQAIGGAGPPRADAGAFEAPGLALARGGEQVSDAANSYAAAYAGARRQADTAQAVSNGAASLNDLNFNLKKLPDSQAAFQQYGDGAKALIQQYSDGIADPQVRASVVAGLTQHATIQQELTRNQAFGVESSQRLAEQDGRMAQAARELANADNPLLRASIMDRANADAKSSAAAGWQPPEAAANKLSAMYRSAVLLKMADDPIAAQAMAKDFTATGSLTADDQAHLADRLENPVYRRIAENAAASTPIGGAAPAVDADTLTRAQAVRSGLVSRGLDDATATAIAARSVLESGAQAAPAPGDGGASHGLLQWNKGRFTDYVGKYGHAPEQGTLDEQLDFIIQELNGPEKAAADAIGAAPDLDGKARAVSLSYVRPGLTPEVKAREAGNTASVARQLAGQPVDDIGAQLADVREKTKDLPLQWQMHAESELLRRYHNGIAATAMQRGDLERGVANLEAAYTQGITSGEIPEDQIRQLIPGSRGQQMIDNLTVARQAGSLFAGVQFASPDQEQSARAALAIPGAIASNQMRVQNHQVVPPAAGAVTTTDETPEATRIRLQMAARYDALLAQKHKALLDDPATFAAAQPDVAAKLQAADPQKPDSVVDGLNASLAMQRQLGLPDEKTRVLSNAQVSGLVAKLHGVDPAKGDMGAALDQLSKQYGDYYPQVMKELVTVGKLNPDYMVLGAMDHPAQTGARQDFQRALLEVNQMGASKFEQNVPQAEKKAIDDGLDNAMQSFRATTALNGVGGAELFRTMNDSVKTLAMSYAAQGLPGGTALDRAVSGILTSKYAFDGALRVPRNVATMDQVKDAGAFVQSQLGPNDIASGAQELNQKTPAERQAILLGAAQRGTWATNKSDDGMVLMGAFRNGPMAMQRPDGSPIEVRFNNLPAVPWRTLPGNRSLRGQGFDPRMQNTPLDAP